MKLQTIFIAIISVLATDSVFGQAIADGFEGPTISPAWSQASQFGSISLSTEQAYAGAQSIKLASTSGGQRSMLMTRQFAAPVKGKFTVFYYDYAPGQETLYQFMFLNNSQSPNMTASLGVADYDANCYQASVGDAAGNYGGPGASCGIYPGTYTTNKSRTLGWHRFEMDVTATGIELKIDGATVYSRTGSFAFDTVGLQMFGPAWRPNTIAYFDDFSHTPPPPSYALCSLYDQTKPVKSGAAIPIKLQLCDVSGANLSSSSLVLTATTLVQVSSVTSETIQDAGNANPDNGFRYDPTLGGTGGYIFNLKTTGLATGTYRLSFSVTGSPDTYSTDFQVK